MNPDRAIGWLIVLVIVIVAAVVIVKALEQL